MTQHPGDANWVRTSGPCPIWVRSSTVHSVEKNAVWRRKYQEEEGKFQTSLLLQILCFSCVWKSVKFPNIVIKTIRLENYQQYNSSAGSLTKTNHTQDWCSLQIRCVWWVKTPQKRPAAIISDVRSHGTPSESSRRPDLWHQRWYNTVLIKHKYISAAEKQEARHRMHRSAPRERRLPKMAERTGPCWHRDLSPTAIWKHFLSSLRA